jgi:hypothetical protein
MPLKKYTSFDKSEEEPKYKPVVKVEDKPIKEEILLTPKNNNNNSNIEILEENIIKFNSGNIKDILEIIKTKYANTDYFFRKKDNELHIVKYNENLKLNINEFVNSLLKFYSTKMDSKKITEGIKVKGNNNFIIIENMKPQNSEKLIDDLTKLLVKKGK